MSSSEMQTGKVIKATRNQYIVLVGKKEWACVVRGKLVGAGDEPLKVKVGDDVEILPISENEATIEKILPRRSWLSRAVDGKAYKEHIVATNIDQIVVIMSTKNPAFKSGLLDRYLIIAEKNKLHAVICLNKIDLDDPASYRDHKTSYEKIGYPFIYTSVLTGEGMEQLKNTLTDKVSVLVGHSGVGKSSVINYLEPEYRVKVGDVSDRTRKGTHTTTHVQLYPLSFGGFLIDTPGIRELGLWNIYQDELPEYYPEFKKLAPHCRFNNCKHRNEPDCAVKAAVRSGEVSRERYENYLQIYDSLRAAPYELIKPR